MTIAGAQVVAAWLGVILLGCFIVAFCYASWLGLAYLYRQIIMDKTIPCTCGHMYSNHYSAIKSCAVSLCSCQHYVARTQTENVDKEYRV